MPTKNALGMRGLINPIRGSSIRDTNITRTVGTNLAASITFETTLKFLFPEVKTFVSVYVKQVKHLRGRNFIRATPIYFGAFTGEKSQSLGMWTSHWEHLVARLSSRKLPSHLSKWETTPSQGTPNIYTSSRFNWFSAINCVIARISQPLPIMPVRFQPLLGYSCRLLR